MLTAVIDTVADGLVIIDHEGRIKAFNPACGRIFGYSAAEVTNRNVRMLMPSPYHDEHDGYLHRYHETGQRKIMGIGREVRGRRKDGSIFPMDLAVGEVKGGKELAFVGMIRDITEQKDSYRALAKARVRNVRLMEALFASFPKAELKIAYTAELGLEMAQSSAIDVIILDVNLPGMSGFEAMAHLKQSRKTAGVPVIGLSARATDSDIGCASRLGFYRYLTKPVDVPELLQTLHSVLDPAHARSSN